MLADYAQKSAVITGAMVESAAATLELGQNAQPVEVERDNPVTAAPGPMAKPVPLVSPMPQLSGQEPRPATPLAPAVKSDNGFRAWQAAVGVAMAAIVTVGGYATWQRQQVPQLRALPGVRAEGSSENFGGGATEFKLERPHAAFTVYLSSHHNATDATLVSQRRQIEAAGYHSFLVAAKVAGQGTLYRLTVGEYDDRSSAANAAAALRDALGLAHAEAVSVADVEGS